MKVAVVILNWNGRALLEHFLPSVVKYSKCAKIYVADNGSTDDSLDFVKHYFPNVSIIRNKGNFGYAKGYNEALKDLEEDIFCLLNSDVEVTENWLDPILKFFEENAETAIIQPKILDYKNKNLFEYAGAAGGFLDKFGYPYCRGRIFNSLEEDLGQYNGNTDIFWASGACFFIRKSVFRKLNGFDESFFAHMEEIDLCWRAKNQGFGVYYIGDSKVFHVGGSTLKTSNPKKTFFNFRNSLFTLVKNANGPIIVLVTIRLFLDGLAGFMYLFQFKFTHILSILKAHIDFYLNLPRLMKQRKELPQTINYYSVRSIVWSYFVDRKRYYFQLKNS